MCVCLCVQNELLEVGWNNSKTTQRDVEKSLNCCGFSHMEVNVTCPAVILSLSLFQIILQVKKKHYFCEDQVILHNGDI